MTAFGGLYLTEGLTGNFVLSSLIVPVLLLLILTAVIAWTCEKSAAREIAEGELLAPEPGAHGLAAAREQIYDYIITAGNRSSARKTGCLD